MYVCGKKNYLGLFLVLWNSVPKKISRATKFVKIQLDVITLSVYLTKSFFYHEYFSSYSRKEKQKINAKNTRLCQIWALLSWPTELSQIPGLWQLT